MSCTLYSEITEFNTELKRQCNGRTDLMSAITAFIKNKEDGSFTTEITDALKNKGIDINNIASDKLSEAILLIREEYNKKHFDPNFSSKLNPSHTKAGQFGYTCIAARKEAVTNAASFMIDIANQIMQEQHKTIDKVIEEENKKIKNKNEADKKAGKKGNQKPITKQQWLAKQTKIKFMRELISRLINIGINPVKAQELVQNGNFIELDKIFENHENTQDANVYAVFRELSSSQSYTEFFKEAFQDNHLSGIREEIDTEVEEYENNEGQFYSEDDLDSAEDYMQTDSNDDSDKKDESISQLNNKDGSNFKDFMQHVDIKIRAYFDSLKRQDSIEKIDKVIKTKDKDGNVITKTIKVPKYDTNNYLGIPTTMSARECVSILYSYGDFTNVESMIKSIRDIARNIEGFAAFNTFADYLEGMKYGTNEGVSNVKTEDFAYQVYRTFAKMIYSKLKTEMSNGNVSSKDSNKTADRRTCLRFEYRNSIKTSSISIDHSSSRFIFDTLSQQINNYNKNIKDLLEDDTLTKEELEEEIKKYDKDRRIIKAELARQLKRYYPTLEEKYINYYLEKAHDENFKTNVATLMTILENTIKSSEESQKSYITQRIEINRRNRENYKLKQKFEEELNVNPNAKTPKYLEVQSIYRKEYISGGSETAAFNLADELINFVPVKTDLNSYNVHGNLSSDVLNDSMISNVIKTLRSTIALENFGKYKSQSRQYDFSNIMVEHRDENNNIINYGIFRHNTETNDFEPTTYAHRLIKASLFNGASNLDTYTNAVYSEMSKGDYTATAFINFFNIEPDYINEKDGGPTNAEMANYFMRIPSDAPKNFSIRMPKMTVGETSYGKNDGLIAIENKSEIDTEINNRINSIPTMINMDFYNGENETKSSQKVYINQIVSHMSSKTLSDIRIWNFKAINKEHYVSGDTVRVRFNYESNGINNEYILEGILEEREGKLYLTKPTFVARNNIMSTDVKRGLENKFRKILKKEGKIIEKININHPIFRQIRNIFMQELTDAANAINVIFKNENGIIGRIDDPNSPNDGEFIFNDGYDNSKETGRKFYSHYHVGNSGTILTKKSDGTYVLEGKVFHSDRFTVLKERKDDNGKIVVDEVNYGELILNEAFDLLYGGVNNTHLPFVATAKGVTVTQLTETQNNSINKHLSDFIFAKIEEANERIKASESFIPANLLSQDNIAEFILNHHIAFASFNDLFEGDTKFYKDSQTFLKRAKESQGSGVPYGIVDYTIDLTLNEPQHIVSDLDKTIFKRKVKNPDGSITEEDVKIGLNDRFTGVTVKNTIRVSKGIRIKEETYDGIKAEEDGAVTKGLKKALIATGMSEQEAKAKAEELMQGMSGYIKEKGIHKGTTVNDAQSYITFEEWVRRVTARGQLYKYLPLIEEILDETKSVSIETIKEFVQVQKNFYYDQYYNPRLHTFASRQIKNAEFVLVPRFIKGTELEQVYNLMKENGIDQLNTEETSKAGKCNVLTIWDKQGNITEQNIKHFRENVNSAREYYDYNHLYTQQETPQHLNAQNKAGIQLTKKIVDNIPNDPNHPLYNEKKRFFELYSANILQSFEELMDEFDLETDKDGKLILDEKGRIKGLNYEVFFDRLKEEIVRQGLDSNSLDYVTLSDNNIAIDFRDGIMAVTNMPNYMSNFSTKLENIAQSLFNSRITRQKLPGFHSAQITGVGFNAREGQVATSTELEYHPERWHKGEKWLTDEEYNKLSETEKEGFVKEMSPYIEVMLPASTFGLTWDGTKEDQDRILAELQEAGLDEIIGYRIPTEGKQSIAIMKVVAFTHDEQGSTIVVPDDWVSQTGSDFDIDSIYGITWVTRINKLTKKIEKVPYLDDTSVSAYFSYTRKRLERMPSTRTKDSIAKLKANSKSTIQDEFNQAMELESAAYHSFSKDIPEQKAIVDEIRRLQKIERNKDKSDLENYKVQIETLINGLEKYKNNHPELSIDNVQRINNLIETNKNVLEKALNSKDRYAQLVGEGVEEIQENKLKEVEAEAVKHHLPTYEEFKKLHADRRNGKQARDNEIVQRMINILSSPYSMEENLSRSNFDKLIDARDNSIDPNVKKRRSLRSPYNFFDQADAQDDVMSGAKLKAFSVVRDTFCSICNTVRPNLPSHSAITIVYNQKDGYTEKQLVDTFGRNNVKSIETGEKDKEGKPLYRFIVTHNTFGWSLNNRNSRGDLITVYSSETTAHILDAVKEGAIPNVNDLTFQVYKIFPDIASDYDTGVPFIMQPGITRIVNAYNESKSIYSKTRSNPINAAIKSIGEEILASKGIKLEKNTSLDKIIEALKPYSKSIANIFNLGNNSDFTISLDDIQAAKLPISANQLVDRLKEKGIFNPSSPVGKENQLLFDLAVILQYNKLSHLGNAISKYTRVCNPDKFGAKQSIYETSKVFDDIQDIITKKDIGSIHDIFTVNGVNMLEKIYPGIAKHGIVDIDKYMQSDEMDSSYPPLHYFLKFASATSVKINRTLFITQQEHFVRELKKIEALFSGRGKKLSAKQYKDLQTYVLNKLYKECDCICKTIIYNPENNCFEFKGEGNNIQEEFRRIFGYDKTPDFTVINKNGEKIDFDVNDINHPTEEEIELYSTLSPAQKIEWIKRKSESSSIFSYINTSLSNGRRTEKFGKQTLEFNEDSADIETVYAEFENAFYNNNPLISMAAMDIIKYSFVVEGFKMRRKAVNKIIRNTALMDEAENGGTGFVTQMNDLIKGISDAARTDMDELREQYIRSHFKQIYQIPTKRVETIKDKNDEEHKELNQMKDGIIVLHPTINKEHNRIAEKYEIIYDNKENKDGNVNYKLNSYVKLIFDKKIELYKIVHNPNKELNDDEIILYPLNPLEENEQSDYSVNNDNNENPSKDYYEDWCRTYYASDNRSLTEAFDATKDSRSENLKYHKYNQDRSNYALDFSFEDKSGPYSGGLEDARNNITKYFSTHKASDTLYLESIALNHYLYKSGVSVTKEIDGVLYNLEREYKYGLSMDYLGKNANKPIDIPNESLRQIISNIRKRDSTGNTVADVIKVTVANRDIIRTEETNELDSTIQELDEVSIRYMYRKKMSEGDPNAIKALNYLDEHKINSSSASIEQNVGEISNITAEYVETTVDNIMNDLTYFVKDTNNVWHSVDDSVTIDLIRNNPDERKRFLKLILDARAFVKTYGLINDLDIDAENAEMQRSLNKIKKAINSLQNATTIAKAEKVFMDAYLAKLSSNPMVKADYLTLTEGYHTASAMDSWINDLQETSSPLIQIISKEVMADIRSKEMQAQKDIAKFRKEVERLKKLAQESGIPINWDHIIDKNGKFVQDYNEEFERVLKELKDNVTNTKINVNFDSEDNETNGIKEWLEAKRKYEEFKANFINQPVVTEYYKRKLEIENEAGIVEDENGNKKWSDAYVELQRLYELKNKLINRISASGISDEYKRQLKDINGKIDELVSDSLYDPINKVRLYKTYFQDPSNPFNLGSKERILYSLESSERLQKFLEDMKSLNEEYFEDESKYGFEEEKEKYLAIIKRKEIRDEYGRLITSTEDLMQDAEYVKAKEWLSNNARYVLGEDTKKLLDDAFKALKEGARGRYTLGRIAKNKEAYDNYGIIDGRKFDDSDIDSIRQEQLDNYDILESAPYSDKRLMSNAPIDDTVFETEFYRNMTSDGTTNSEYLEKVSEINNILRKYYYPSEKIIHTHEISLEDLKALRKLYDELSNLKKKEDGTNDKSVHNYIKNHVDFVTNDELCREQDVIAKSKIGENGQSWYDAWFDLNYDLVKDNEGNPIFDENGKAQFKPNRFIYGYAIPRGYKHDGTGDNSLVNTKKTDALRTIHAYYTTEPTVYYYEKLREMRAKSDDEYNEWVAKNHIYNPYTHAMEPIACWTTLKVKPMYDDGEWLPNFNQKTRKVKDKYKNSEYKEGLSHKANYKKGNGIYDNTVITEKSEQELEIEKLFKSKIREYAKTTAANRFFDEGYMVSKAKGAEHDAKFMAKELAKFLGWIDNSTGKEDWRLDSQIDYADDVTMTMPLTTLLKSKESISIDYKQPIQEENESDEDYKKRLEEYNKYKKEAEEKNAEIHRNMLDRNWEAVMEDFIAKAAHFNAVQDNKYMLFFGKNMIDKIETYIKYQGRNTYKKLHQSDPNADPKYATQVDTNLQKQYINWVRRIVYDQWKEPNGALTRAANILQSLTSSKFMMLNVTGGIANVTVGETNVIAEAWAKEYFDAKNWAKGLARWHKAIPSFIADLYSDRASSLESAIAKAFNVIDFEEYSGVVPTKDMAEYTKRLRDAMFSPQAMGEHGMQISAMFSMMESHRLVENKDYEKNGKSRYSALNKQEFIRSCHEQALKEILDEEGQRKFKKYIEYILKDPNKKKDYMTFRKDFTREFIDLYAKDKKAEFFKHKKELQEKEIKKFNACPTLISQLALKDGIMDFEDGSILQQLSEKEAYHILGEFKNRVISVNKKIHGIYDKLGSARLESQWYGGVVMQYHKHIYPGLMKRWRRQGYYNEERGTIEKGCYKSIRDFLAIPLSNAKFARELQEVNGMTDMQLEATKGIQNIVRNYIEFFTHLKLNYNTLPDYEKANIRRSLGDVAGMMSAVCLAIGLRVAWDGDENSFIYNLFMYEADRLASESMMYNPIGLISEGKKLWSSPIAAQSFITDGINTLGLISQYIIQGDEFDPYYQSGLYAGESKLEIKLKRNIPMWHSIQMLERLNRSNKYYKLGENILGIVPVKDIADFIRINY